MSTYHTTTLHVDIYQDGRFKKAALLSVKQEKDFATGEWLVTTNTLAEAVKQRFPYPCISTQVSPSMTNMTKSEFYNSVSKCPADCQLFFQFPLGRQLQIYNIHQELPCTLVLRTSPLCLQKDFRYLVRMCFSTAFDQAPDDAELIFRYNGINHKLSKVTIQPRALKVILHE